MYVFRNLYTDCVFHTSIHHLIVMQGPKPPQEGVLVFGLFLDGARFDPHSRSIQDSRPEERFCRLPEVYFQPTKVSTLLSVCIEMHFRDI